jgi:flagellar L-ring protein precursor FlgH
MPTPSRWIFEEGREMNKKKWIPLVLVFGSLWMFAPGCATTRPAPIPLSPYFPKERIPASIPAPSEGSLWPSNVSFSLFADLKARNIGDIVTINIVESASASKNATTSTARNSDIEASWSGVLSKLSGDWLGSDQKAAFATSFDGKGETTRKSSLNAYITAQVVQVLPNGNLAIQGSRQVQVNNENQFINIQGVVRSEDISSNNIVLSTFIADAKIELSGRGVISDKQRVGWLTRILDWVWPF